MNLPAIARRAQARATAVAVALVSLSALVLYLMLTGSVCAVAGVFLLWGLPWSLLAAAALMFILAFLILRGMSNG